jgi:hypothetical protein
MIDQIIMIFFFFAVLRVMWGFAIHDDDNLRTAKTYTKRFQLSHSTRNAANTTINYRRQLRSIQQVKQ